MDHPITAPLDFEAALQQAMRAAGIETPRVPDGSPDAAPLAAAMERVRVALPLVDNMGCTRDDRDLYTHIDDLAEGARAAYPESLCKAGCSACCHYPAGLFTASRAEWEAIYDHIAETWSAERVMRMVRRFWDSHGPYMRRLKAIEWLMEFPLPVNAKRQAVPLACPFLEDDRCSIYAARPTFCRTFGQFTFKYWWQREPTLYACDKQTEHLEPVTRRPGRAHLPSFNPIFHKRFVLSQKGKRHLLSLWVAARWPERWLDAQRRGDQEA